MKLLTGFMLIGVMTALMVAGCYNPKPWQMGYLPPNAETARALQFALIWRETSGIPIAKVETPKGFTITPAEAVKPIMARSTRPPWAEFYLFADATSYYFGNTRRGAQLSGPEPGHWIIDGTTGKTTYVEKEDTEQSGA